MSLCKKARAKVQKEAAEQAILPVTHQEFAHKIDPQHTSHKNEKGVGVPDEHHGPWTVRPIVSEKGGRKGVIGRLPVIHVGVLQVIREWDAG